MKVQAPKPYNNTASLGLGIVGTAALSLAALYLLAEWLVPDLTQHMDGFAFILVLIGLVTKQAECLLMRRDLRAKSRR